jgi:hypothetical protein
MLLPAVVTRHIDTDIRIASREAIIKISPDKTANDISVIAILKIISEE